MPGWDRLRNVAKQQQLARQQKVNTPLTCADEIYEREFMKGEMVMSELFMRLPGVMVEEWQAEVDKFYAANPDLEGVDIESLTEGDFRHAP